MQRVVILWGLSWMVLASGALLVCGDDRWSVIEFDRVWLGTAHDLRNQSLDHLMTGVTWLGSLVLLLPLTGLRAWYLFRAGHRRESAFIMLALLGASAIGHLVKLWVARPRPELFAAWSPMPEDWSYPSAHAMQITAAAMALFLVSTRRHVAWAAALSVVVLWVGLSRIYLQVHFPSDVIAGTLASALWVGGLYALIFRPRSGLGRGRGDAA
ncbi:MAG: phosphatase PAP2 family protein [Thiobacillus sp.]|nr:phosphatase PAP2 family protein [Thiobacillus sp.]